ncbi:uncharacterized protein HMPREF1120_09133 [Exophiala dermatitidis NIH/UT8656]|uniref:Uncharacterized protein n=1 Tax=Exophiala dermatitidis (strain ATCC 34100 / CBS 525.76 / NIH/UT8656) TaxID=858893 RepID=H6CBQ0_EXODN|nr:uncharacterized protein HMPREF1120_09133 [Exophiala dermatitidis NIH/UT8656]EHY61197.1 hypothetical protein HMPREF1120_09133 [Exophiala dermatitidis NIH/UT8656]
MRLREDHPLPCTFCCSLTDIFMSLAILSSFCFRDSIRARTSGPGFSTDSGVGLAVPLSKASYLSRQALWEKLMTGCVGKQCKQSDHTITRSNLPWQASCDPRQCATFGLLPLRWLSRSPSRLWQRRRPRPRPSWVSGQASAG